ncbi:MAG: hypothetical protein IKO28_06385 [Prevotella sp.]|nr:hypothetical protein [Prevotella sp.]
MEFLNVKSLGKEPYACRVEDNFIEVVPLEAAVHIRFEFLPKKNPKTADWELVTGAIITTWGGYKYHIPGGTARRLYAKVENSMLKI